MIIEDKTFVSIKYELRFDNSDNEVVEKTTEDNPLNFIVGTQKMIPAFEQKLMNLKIRDSFSFVLQPEEAYGKYNPEGIMNLSIDVFMQNGKIDENLIQLGRTLRLQMNNGKVVHGIVKKVTPDEVTIDINHPLAGKTLFFSGEVLNIRTATKEELSDTGHKCTGCGKH